MMNDRGEMLAAALGLLEEGVAILDEHANVVFWNEAAADLTGYPAEAVVAHKCPQDLFCVDRAHREKISITRRWTAPEIFADHDFLERPARVSVHHHRGHAVPAMLRKLPLRNAHGEVSGAALLFYPVEQMDTLPHGELGEGVGIERSAANMEDRLDAAHHLWRTNRVPCGLLWVTVDQAHRLRRTHGRDACEAMLRIVEQTLWRQMKPAEAIARWGNDEFLMLTHERTAELLAEHAHRLAGCARTADFRWWGDRVSLTVSIGAAQMGEPDTLDSLLHRAQHAMQSSMYAGGNHVTVAA